MKAFARTTAARPGPTFCTLGDTLCRVRFWTEPEWAALDPARRPDAAVHRPGAGRVAPVPVHDFS